MICSSGVGAKEYSCLMTDCIVDLQLNFNGQCFPRWLPGEHTKKTDDALDFGQSSEMPSGFTPEALPHFQAAYPGRPITEDNLFYYIYGILHSEDYRSRYANNLMKELPRIPRVATYEQFMAFVEAGQELAELHVHFDDVTPYAGVTIEYTKPGKPSYRALRRLSRLFGDVSVLDEARGLTENPVALDALDELEAVYNPHVDFDGVYALAKEHILRLQTEN